MAPSPLRDAPASHHRVLAELARAHYLEGTSKVQLARDTGLSRFQVATLLREAVDRGIVRISIHPPVDTDDESLARLLGIPRAVTAVPDDATGLTAVAALAAGVLTDTIRPGDTVGVSWSRTIQAVMSRLPAMPECTFVQLAGALASDQDTAGPRLLAEVDAGSVWPLWAPLVVEGAAALARSPEVRSTLDRARSLDVAVIAIGRWAPGGSTVWDRVPEPTRRLAVAAGAVAEISGHLLAADGTRLSTPVEDLIVAADLEHMAAARHTVALARGGDRAPAVRAAVRAGLVDTLVCDADLHEALMADHRHPTEDAR
ncbi:DeoR family transcriptional regulator [Micrococcus luteus]|uniref:sugar-binding domain-containing protein n=1 Tax=Micrococcus TaxID=1269 RepID=UPI000DEA717E|nr:MULTISPECIES: sugar-binding domain-containing protein [Micrococcus]MBO1027872.1 DeoR family transcriptional regulator [Micrococcus luteus]MCV7501903.1 Cro/Cl family transcriptional regulator [Micrococcus luteus]MCV7558146.1 Cro/Cl family transcriptional regulator [Micrococcus luteus]RBO88739.1 DNA-binding transcriptional regulator LsrR (DeoR family) [Micrococcus sp. KT16]